MTKTSNPPQVEFKECLASGQSHSRSQSIEDRLLILVFTTTLAVFGLRSLGSIFSTTSSEVSAAEKRRLGEFPKISSFRREAAQFPGKFERFYNDHFSQRLFLTGALNYLRFQFLNCSGNKDVMVGKNGWLFYSDPWARLAQANLNQFDEHSAKKWADVFILRQQLLAKFNVKFILMLIPDKGSIYVDFLPVDHYRHAGLSRIESLQKYLKNGSSLDFVDARRCLLDNKGSASQLFYRSDSHWNQLGALIVANELLSHVSSAFPAVKPFHEQELQMSRFDHPGDLTQMLGFSDWVKDKDCPSFSVRQMPLAASLPGQVPYMPGCDFTTESTHKNLPRLCMLRDSFATALIPFLSERFSFADYHWTTRFNLTLLLKERPDVVIEEINENSLYADPPEYSFPTEVR